MQEIITKLTRLMDMRRSLDSIPVNLQQFYTAISSPGYVNGRTPVTHTIWVVNEEAVSARLAQKA